MITSHCSVNLLAIMLMLPTGINPLFFALDLWFALNTVLFNKLIALISPVEIDEFVLSFWPASA